MAASRGTEIGIDRAYPVDATTTITNEATRTETVAAEARHARINLPRDDWFDQIVR